MKRGASPLGEPPKCSPVRPDALGRLAIAEIAGRVARLTVHHRDPERFFIERSEIVADLRALERVLPPKTYAGGKGAGNR